MRHRSRKREIIYENRRPLVEKMLQERPWCEACPVIAGEAMQRIYVRRPSQDVHELINRSQGGSILDLVNLLAVCRKCHTWITTHPYKAERLGLHLPGWATDDMIAEAKTVRNEWAYGVGKGPSWMS